MNHPYPVHPGSKSGFALISVLALVSLAALTATAFLASARLERQATRPIGETTRLQMTLNTGRECAAEVINRIGEPYWNFVTTYWRTDLTNELGYLFVGKPSASNNLIWYYYCGFTPAQWTNLDSADMNSRIRATNTVCQATYSNNMQTFMASATSGFSATPLLTDPKCVQIPLLGGRTSPTVGWVYIKQDIRTNPSSTTTSNLPVARFAYFIEDLGGLIDAERMCGTINRDTGTNAEEISLANLAGSSASNIAIASLSSKRPQYLTPGMLLATNGGVLTSTNDLRYFASRLRYCNWTVNANWDRIPYVPISSTLVNGTYYPSKAGQRKTNLSDTTLLTPGGATKIAASIITNYPMFTNRAGGMNGTNYVNAIAANIVDYADTDSTPTTVGGSVGWDAYPLPTQIFDRMVWNKAQKTLTVTTYLQLWNQSTRTSPAVSYTFTNNFQDTYTNGIRIQTNVWSTNIAVPLLNPNQGTILALAMPVIANLNTNMINSNGDLPINGSDKYFANTFSLTLGSAQIAVMNTKYERKAKTLQDGIPEWSGCLPTLRYDELIPRILTTGDPRMINYITNGGNSTNAVNYQGNSVWASYGQTRTASSGFSDRWNADPRNWPDGISSTTYPVTGQQPGNVNSPPTIGLFSPPGVALCKLSNTNFFTNITELGNIFDPIQWAPASTATVGNQSDYVNCDISPAPTWNANPMYGGGQTLRIGRPEHSRFAFTNLVAGGNAVPSLGTSAAGLLDLFCVTNTYNWAGKININTAPPPVLAALAGGITLTKDPNKVGSPANANMIKQFTNGVMLFRNMYPFITPSQLSFISANYGTTGWTNSAVWTQNAVFGTNSSGGGLTGVTSINDEGREEWFSKIYNLTCVQSFNYRIYVVAQLTDTNGNPKGAMMRKYYQLHLRHNQPTGNASTPDQQSPSVSPVVTYEAFY
jgi:hypothetical protein